MSDPQRQPFERDALVDKPGIVGARWWQRSLVEVPDTTGRRNALRTLLLVGGAIGGLGLVMAAAGASCAADDTKTENRNALEMQKQFGWSFGAVTESLTFDGQSTQPFDRAALPRMPDELRPSRPDLLPYYVPTLFQSPSALPLAVPVEETSTVTPLAQALVPIFTAAMDTAYRRGRALASLFTAAPAGVALVVDLPGPEAVAFAAGAASVFDPVFGFDNWPHPRAVVPAHLTLAAAAYYQPLFAKHPAGRAAPPMFVLDRRRLDAYTDESSQFDNRHVARLPAAAALRTLGVKRLLYVVPTDADTLELDDLNDDFVADAGAGIEMKRVAASALSTDPPDPGKSFTPVPRATAYSSGQAGSAGARPRPTNFGMVPVVLAAAGGAILGAKLSRSGSWNRSFGGSGA